MPEQQRNDRPGQRDGGQDQNPGKKHDTLARARSSRSERGRGSDGGNKGKKGAQRRGER
jgi:hypothetical protein